MQSKYIIAFIIIMSSIIACQNQTGEYVCTPCDLSCDKLSFAKGGLCPHCNMALLKKSDLDKVLILNEVDIGNYSGEFLIQGGNNNEQKKIKVYYHKPEHFQPDSKILIVLPGAGRNADSYRDAWIPLSEKYNVLILSLMYSEEDYEFEDYHLCGLVYDIDLKNSLQYIENTNVVNLDEEKFTYEINSAEEDWIFNDFDRIFDLVVDVTNSAQKKYDIFGHSAGGQILHRFAIFQPDSKADNILSSNSGFYTLPSFDYKLPFGLKNTSLNAEKLNSSFNKKLILLVGALDNQNETGGTLLRSPTVDKHGIHRLERAHYFYNQSEEMAKLNSFDFNWELKIVSNTGHDHRKMATVAAEYLYAE